VPARTRRPHPAHSTIVNLSLATSERYRTPRDWQEHTEWHNLVGFQRVGEILRDYVRKGSRLYVEGSLRTRSWDDRQTGQRRHRSEIVVTEISLLSPPPDGGSDDVEHHVSGQGFAPPEFSENRRSNRKRSLIDLPKTITPDQGSIRGCWRI